MSADAEIKKPPYLSFVTFKNFIEGLKSGVIPSRIDKSLMVGQSGTNQSYLMSALRFFSLIAGEGEPQPDLEVLVHGQEAEQKALWKRMFLDSYAPIVGDLDLERATVGQLHEKFSALNLNGETVRKCHSFFSAAAEEASVPLASHLKVVTRKSGTSGVRKSRKPRVAPKPDSDAPPIVPQVAGHTHATLPLSSDNARFVKLTAPATVTSVELNRIQQWLSFQLIVEDPTDDD